MGIRKYSSVASEKSISELLPATGTGSDTLTLEDVQGLPTIADGSGDTFTLVLSPDTVDEEIVTVTAVSGTQLTITRAEEGTGPAKSHPAQRKARHMITGRDLQDAQNHFASSVAHNVTEVVGRTEGQTLLNKRLDSPKLNENVILNATSTQLNNLAGLTATPTELNYVAGVTSSIQAQFSALEAFPKGMISPFAGTAAPTGWLLCDGTAVSRTTYALLYAVVGDAYGAGDGTTTFNLPNLKGRAIVGIDPADTDFDTRGKTGGWKATQAHTHDLSNHTHGDDHVHGVYGAGAHGHSLIMRFTTPTSHDHAISGASNPLPAMQGDPSSGDIGNYNGTAIGGVGDHAHSLNFKSEAGYGASTGGPSNNSSGSFGTGALAAATNGNLQPFMSLHYIIKH